MPMSPRLLRPMAASGFNPRRIAGLQGWWDASDIASLSTVPGGSTAPADSAGVGQISDLSGNGRHFTQDASGNDQPLLITSFINNRNVLRFDGSNDQMRCPAMGVAIAQPFTFFWILRRTHNSALVNMLDVYAGNRVIFASNGNPAGVRLFNTTVFDSSGSLLPQNTPVLLTGTLNGASSEIRTNGVSRQTGNAGSTGMSSTTAFTLGSQPTSNFWAGEMGEIIFASNVTANELTATENYLMKKWGIA